jgi:hypothetical protein
VTYLQDVPFFGSYFLLIAAAPIFADPEVEGNVLTSAVPTSFLCGG